MKISLLALFLSAVVPAFPETNDNIKGDVVPDRNIDYRIELQSTFSDGNTPLWLNANRHGLSSLSETNGYLRAALSRPLERDSAKRWGLGYALDVAVPYNFTSKFVVQQAFVEGRWLHGALTVGSKEYPMELKNNELSSGSQTLGINARPVPQVRIALPEYWTLPVANDWIHLKGHIAYGLMTDDNWQHDFTGRASKYADNVLYHSKAGYLKIGKEGSRFPLSVELGLEMAATFGGTLHYIDDNGDMVVVENGAGLKAFWNAFVPGGSDAGEDIYKNVEGNQVGSWLVRLNWDARTWRLSVYADKYFEDHSSMFQLDYDGYGDGDEWNVEKDKRYLLYDFKDMMLGAELNLKNGTWLRDVVFEYIYTKYQSGPINHDHNGGISDHIGGKDNFYNHSLYTGWQHWGQVIGNPLYLSPIYNEDGTVMVKNNRFVALHLGLSGRPTDKFSYRLLTSWQEGLGTYDEPYTSKRYNLSFLVEGEYAFKSRLLDGWKVRGSFGMDFGKLRGDNNGVQITVSKSGLLKF